MKRLITLLLTAVVVFGSIVTFSRPVEAESLYIRKIVSVVYDDSGSMYGSKSVYANYAMQAFCGMLNSEDQLYITYMSKAEHDVNFEPMEIDLSANGIQGSVDTVRAHVQPYYQSTPYTAVELAYEKLLSVKDSNPNTQYWLVIITDGDFAECQYMSAVDRQKFLDDNIGGYIDTVMPNGTNPQITFLGIGEVASPKEDKSRGLHTYSASDESEIVEAMSKMADRISGRTRLSQSEIHMLDDKTIQVSSSIPLLNIVVFAQGSNANLVGATYGDDISAIPIERSASLFYPGYDGLVGGAYLLGDSMNIIQKGEYTLTFDKSVKLEEVVVLFEPALELRMNITANGKVLSTQADLQELMAGDKISVECRIFEMGTDEEITPSLMPSNTKFEVTVSEDGQVAKKTSGEKMQLSDYELNEIKTKITGSLIIDGFNPIEVSVEFTPAKFVPKTVYTIDASFAGVKNVKLDDISVNDQLKIIFTVNADGVPITDPEIVKSLSPVVDVFPQGNGGNIEYSDGGQIIFTPKIASVPSANDGSFDVDVCCTINDGTQAKATYTVLISSYEIVGIDCEDQVSKTNLFNNESAVTFNIYKDGVKLEKAAVENNISVSLNNAHSDLEAKVLVESDGTIRVIPFGGKELKKNFGNWLFVNWHKYFRISDEDVVVTLDHTYGSATAEIDVTGADGAYILLNVVLPMVIIAAFLFAIGWYIYVVNAKPKFLPDASIYIGKIYISGRRGGRYHEVEKMVEIPLKQYNKFKYIMAPTMKPKVINVGNNVYISAGYSGRINCHCPVWYSGDIRPLTGVFDNLSHPSRTLAYIRNNDCLRVRTINPYDGETVKPITSIDRPNPENYYVCTDNKSIEPIDGVLTIEKGEIFAYAIRIDN